MDDTSASSVVLFVVILAVVEIVAVAVAHWRGRHPLPSALRGVLLVLALASLYATMAHYETFDDLRYADTKENAQSILDSSLLPGAGIVLGPFECALAVIAAISVAGASNS